MPDMLRILQVLEPSGGGSGRHFIDLSRGLQGRGHAVTAVYSPVRAEERFVSELRGAGLSAVIPLSMRRAVGPWDAAAWRQLQDVIRTNGPFDIIHGHSSKAGALTRMRLPGVHVPRVYTPHAFRTMDPTLSMKGRLIYGGVEWLLGRFLSDRVICVSSDEMNHARSFGLPASLLRVVVNGVATPRPDGRQTLRQQFGIPDDALVYGFIGRLSAQKAPERLIAAFGRIAATLPQAHLLMVGFGELEIDLRKHINTAGLEPQVHLISEVPGPDAMCAFDALVMPSRYEAMSYVMLEGAAAGKPLILSDVGGTRMVLEDGVNGIMVPNTDDPAPLAEAMLALADDEKRAAFAARARDRANGYGLDAMVSQTLDVYRELIEAKKSR